MKRPIFRAIFSGNAHVFKEIAKCLSCLERLKLFLHEDGIFIQDTKPDKKILYNISIPRKGIKDYICKKTMYISVNNKHLYTNCLKDVKKKDTLEIVIEDDKDNIKFFTRQTNFSPSPRDDCYVTSFLEVNPNTFGAKIPQGYSFPFNVDSSDFIRLKPIASRNNALDKDIVIKVGGSSYASFFLDSDAYKKEVIFGIQEDSEESFEDTYSSSLLSYVIKIHSFSKLVTIWPPNRIHWGKLPLKFSSSLGGMGEIEIYIKSNIQLECGSEK